MRLPSLLRREPLLRMWGNGELEKLFEDFFTRVRMPALPAGGGEFGFVPDVDVIEHENEYVVRVELPGLSLHDVNVTMEGDALQIRGDKKTEKEEKKENYYVCERAHGSFVRTISLPVAVDPERIEAKLERGILEIVCPKSETVRPRRIEVRGADRPETAAALKTGSPEAARPREERAREKR